MDPNASTDDDGEDIFTCYVKIEDCGPAGGANIAPCAEDRTCTKNDCRAFCISKGSGCCEFRDSGVCSWLENGVSKYSPSAFDSYIIQCTYGSTEGNKLVREILYNVHMDPQRVTNW